MWGFYENAFVWAVAAFHCEALNTFWNMFIGWSLGLSAQQTQPCFFVSFTVLFVTQNTTIMWILFVIHVSVFFFNLFFFFKKSNFPFMKQYKLDAFLKQVPKTILQISFKLTKSFYSVNKGQSFVSPSVSPIVL